MGSPGRAEATAAYGPFAETTPRGQTGWIDDRRRPLAERLHAVLSQLDGSTRFTYTVWRGSNPASIVVSRDDVVDTFIQAAGSVEAMTVEARVRGADGAYHLYALGKEPPTGEPSVMVAIGPKRSVRVFPSEVFTADEAAAIFADFTRTDTVAEFYARRELDLSAVQSEPR